MKNNCFAFDRSQVFALLLLAPITFLTGCTNMTTNTDSYILDPQKACNYETHDYYKKFKSELKHLEKSLTHALKNNTSTAWDDFAIYANYFCQNDNRLRDNDTLTKIQTNDCNIEIHRIKQLIQVARIMIPMCRFEERDLNSYSTFSEFSDAYQTTILNNPHEIRLDYEFEKIIHCKKNELADTFTNIKQEYNGVEYNAVRELEYKQKRFINDAACNDINDANRLFKEGSWKWWWWCDDEEKFIEAGGHLTRILDEKWVNDSIREKAVLSLREVELSESEQKIVYNTRPLTAYRSLSKYPQKSYCFEHELWTSFIKNISRYE